MSKLSDRNFNLKMFLPRILRMNGNSAINQPSASRFLLWVDAVGGFLVCLEDRVVLGQPVPDSQVDIPILGDLSRRHASICRDEEGYLIEPMRDVRLDGQQIQRPTLLADGSLIDLKSPSGQGGVQLKFCRPHALSATARLEFVSRHRTQPSADAVLLMADTCILGPGKNNHVVCPKWSSDVVIFRRGAELYCQVTGTLEKGSLENGTLEIDGKNYGGPGKKAQGPVSLNSRVQGEDFALSFEAL